MADTFACIDAAMVRAPLPLTIRFGNWLMERRVFLRYRLRTETGFKGAVCVDTRDGLLAALVRRSIAPPADCVDAGGYARAYPHFTQ